MASDLVTVPRSTLERCRALVEAVQDAETEEGKAGATYSGKPIPWRWITVRGRDKIRALDEADALLLSDLDAALQP